MTSATADPPRIYVACLASYNAGKLHGIWITIHSDTSAEQIQAEIEQMLATSPIPEAKEWAIHTFENWQGIEIAEQEPLERIVELAQMLHQHGQAFSAYCSLSYSDATPDGFRDSYQGKYKSEEDFAQALWEKQGKLQALRQLEIDNSYIDWAAVARDLFINSYCSMDISTEEVYVFTR